MVGRVYVKRPNPVHAVQYGITPLSDIEAFIDCSLKNPTSAPWIPYVNTPAGYRSVQDGDYIVKASDGSLTVWPAKAFEAEFQLGSEP